MFNFLIPFLLLLFVNIVSAEEPLLQELNQSSINSRANLACTRVVGGWYTWRKSSILGRYQNGRRGKMVMSCRARTPFRLWLIPGDYWCVGNVKSFTIYGRNYLCQVRRIKIR